MENAYRKVIITDNVYVKFSIHILRFFIHTLLQLPAILDVIQQPVASDWMTVVSGVSWLLLG